MSFLSLAGGAAGAFLPKASTRSARLVDRAGAWNAVAQAARRSTRRLRAIAKDLQQVEAMGMRWRVNMGFVKWQKQSKAELWAGFSWFIRCSHGDSIASARETKR